ncbi:AEC family transporter [Treponema phagedenis]|uniref:AEC family transporter n=1 Tax=Treponema phagedenis TaxID=162 RepID=UPI0011E772B8|nr:AEC family transporter [Treponema phagedenis]QEK01112.1 AEC family transporter [Treponema phagedenis]QEK06120.1 AEC family transporter [Treponema phagedenis]
MGSFFLAFNAVMPMVILVGFGYFLKEFHYLDQTTILKLNKLCVDLLLPILTFNNIRKTRLSDIFDLHFILYAAGSIFAAIFLLMVLVPFIEKDRKKQGVIVQGSFRSNFIMLGIPLSTYIAGEASTAIASMLIMVIIPIFNGSAVVLLSYYGGKIVSKKNLIIGILKNHMVAASLIGIAASVIQLQLPAFIDKPFLDIGKIGSILPIIILGSMLDFSKISANRKNLIITIMGKLIGMPLVFLSIAIILGFGANKIAALIALYSSPTAVISVMMAYQFDCDYELAAQVVAFSTVVSCITIFATVFLLNFIGII